MADVHSCIFFFFQFSFFLDHNSQNISSVSIKGELMNSLTEICFDSLLQYSILKVNISMFKRRLDSNREC